MGDPQSSFAFLVLFAVVVLLAVLVFARKRPLWLIGRLFRFLFRPFKALRRLLRRGSKHGASPGALIEQSAVSSLKHVLFGESQVDAALAENPRINRKALHRRGFFFTTVEPGEGFLNLSAQLSEAEAQEAYDNSQGLFDRELPYFDRSGSFFEEIEGKLIVDMLGRSDVDCLYYLNEVRRAGNANVRKLATWLSLFLFSFVTFSIFLDSVIVPATVSEQALSGSFGDFLRDNAEVIVSLVMLVGFASVSGVLYFSFIWAQWNNGREMNDFINRYFSQLGQQYQYAVARCSKVHNANSDAERKTAKDSSRIWFTAMEWIAFRQFYIELFCRNTIYQIWRNSGSYVFYVPVAFLVVVVLGSEFLAARLGDPSLGLLSAEAQLWHLHWLSYASLGTLALMYAIFLSSATRKLLGAIKPNEWSGFRKREYRKTVADLVSLYVGEIVFQRYKGQFQQDVAGVN